MSRRTKIVGTLGPATDDPAVLDAVLAAGLDMARINFSHGTGDEHLARIARYRDAAKRAGKVAAVLADLPGPKLRAKITSDRILAVGDVVAFSLSDVSVEPNDIVITEPEILADVRPGQRVLLDDGRLRLEATSNGHGRLLATVKIGGTLKPNKGINLPDTPLSIGAVTERDKIAIAVAVKGRADWLALSFVRSPDAADELRTITAGYGYRGPVLAKIERPEAVDRAAAIIHAFDGIMVARGDLGVEIPLERVPAVQKRLISEARAAGKPVITATEMLESMTTNPRPTRAEASDVANAIYDGTDAVMLSGETAVGSYPVEAVSCMARIAAETDENLRGHRHHAADVFPPTGDIDDPIALAACELAEEVGASAIITPTVSGRTARLLARHRPSAQIVTPAPTDEVLRRLAVVWGLQPVPMSWLPPGQDRMEAAVKDAYRSGVVRDGDRVVVLAGHPIEGGLRFPTVRVVRVGEGGSSQEP